MFGNPDYAPQPVHWGGQQFADPQMLARWLRARGASPAIWALRHPGAAQGLGMPTPHNIPAAPPVQAGAGGGMMGPGLPQPGPMAGPPPGLPGAMAPQHPAGPLGDAWGFSGPHPVGPPPMPEAPTRSGLPPRYATPWAPEGPEGMAGIPGNEGMPRQSEGEASALMAALLGSSKPIGRVRRPPKRSVSRRSASEHGRGPGAKPQPGFGGGKIAVPASKDHTPYTHPKGDMVWHASDAARQRREEKRLRRRGLKDLRSREF